VRSEEHLLVADQVSEFAGQVCRLLSETELAARLAAEGRRLAVRDYSWRRSGELLAKMHRSVSGASEASAERNRSAPEPADDPPSKRLGSIR
jgi:hypothetical protein